MESLFNYISSLSRGSAHLAVNMVWLGLALTSVVWLLWRFARPNEARIRYAAWWSVLVMVMLVPMILTSPAARFIRDGFEPQQPATTLHKSHQKSEMPARETLTGPTTRRLPRMSSPRLQSSPSTVMAAAARPEVDRTVTARSIKQEATAPSVGAMLLGLLPMTLLVVWVSVTFLMVLRLARAHRRMAQIKRASRPITLDRWFGDNDPLQKAGTSRAVQIRSSAEIDLPVAAGLGQAVILIPEHLIEELSRSELEAVIRHELAHIRRWDDWTKLFQKLLEAVVFFHPAVRWIGNQLDLEREMACDEQVVQETGDATGYAQCLTRLAQLTTGSGTALVPGALTSHKQIFKRIGSLLNSSGSRMQYRRTRIVGLFVSVLAALVLVIQAAPVIAVPGRAVTLDELSATVRSILPTPEVEPPVEETLPQEEPPIESPQADPDTPEVNPNAPEIQPAVSGPEAPSGPTPVPSNTTENPGGRPQTAAKADPTPEAEPPARVVDWNDGIFDVPISGVVHGKNDEPSTVVWTADDQLVRVAMQGRVRFGADNKSIKSVAKDGFVAVKEINDRDGSSCCEVDIVRGKGGKLDYHFFVRGKPAEFDKGAERWLNKVLRRAVPELRVWSQSPSSSRSGLEGTTVLTYDPDDDVAYAYSSADAGETPQVIGLGDGSAYSYSVDDVGDVAVAPVEDTDDGSYYLYAPDDDESGSSVTVYTSSGSKGRRSKGVVGRAVDWAEDVIDGMSFGSNYIIEDDGNYKIAWKEGRSSVRVELEGEIEFTDDDRGIKSISRRGFLAVTEKSGRTRRDLEVEANPDGSLDYQFYIDGESTDFDEEAQEWLGDLLTEVIRRSGFGAEARVRRHYDEGGVDGVLDEIRLIESDYVKRMYFDGLVAIDGLTDDDYSEIIVAVDRQLDSDYEKAELLIGMADRFQQNPEMLNLFVDAVATIDSDYETRRVLSEISLDDDAGPQVVATVLAIADGMDSDYEKAELLIEMAPMVSDDSVMLEAYVTTVEGMDSDYETRRVLNELSLNDDVSEQLILTVLRIAARMDSDYEKAELLIDMAPYSSRYAEARQAYVMAIRNTDSDYETRRIISALSDKEDLDRDAIKDLLEMADEMDSDYEKAELLIELSELCDDDPDLQLIVIEAASGLDSDWETRRVLSSQGIDCESQPELTEAMLEVVEQLDSDYETAEILLDLAQCAASDEEFRRLYLNAAENIDSDYDRKRVLAELIDEADEPDSSFIVDVLLIVEDMSSDYEKVEILTLLAPACRGNDALENAYTDVVETMDSDFEIDRAYSRLYRRKGGSGSRGD